jgi:hypothetical protein
VRASHDVQPRSEARGAARALYEALAPTNALSRSNRRFKASKVARTAASRRSARTIAVPMNVS